MKETAVSRIKSDAIFHRECHRFCDQECFFTDKMAAKSNIQMVNLKTMALQLPFYFLPDIPIVHSAMLNEGHLRAGLVEGKRRFCHTYRHQLFS